MRPPTQLLWKPQPRCPLQMLRTMLDSANLWSRMPLRQWRKYLAWGPMWISLGPAMLVAHLRRSMKLVKRPQHQDEQESILEWMRQRLKICIDGDTGG